MPKTQPMDMWERFDANAKPKPSKLSEFLSDPDKSVPRERIFSYRLFSDLKLAAAQCGYHLQHYEPDVDRDGHDVIFEDHFRLTSQQLKVVYGRTKKWSIRNRLILPDVNYTDALGFAKNDEPRGVVLTQDEGIQGGVILIEPTVSQDGALERVTYHYWDVLVLLATRYALLQKNVPAKSETAARIIEEMRNNSPDSKVKLRRSHFLTARDPETLLALMGLQSRYPSSWRLDVVRYVSMELDPHMIGKENESDKQACGQDVTENLSQLIV